MSWHGYVMIHSSDVASAQSAVIGGDNPSHNWHSVDVGDYIIAEALFDASALSGIHRMGRLRSWSGSGQCARRFLSAAIYSVTSLNDSGDGTLRDALEADGERIIKFDVSGTIELESQIAITNPDVIVLGETAPNGGVCVKGNQISIETHGVILRHLRIRPGAVLCDALHFMSPARDVVVENCSLSWGVDENLGIGNPVEDIVIRDCIISEALNDSVHPKGEHSMGALVSYGATGVTIERCLFAFNFQRNPLVMDGRVDFVNNLISGFVTSPQFGDAQVNDGDMSRVNFIGNHIAHWYYGTYCRGTVLSYHEEPRLSLWLEGNTVTDVPFEQQSDIVQRLFAESDNLQISDFLANERFDTLSQTADPMDVSDVFGCVLANAGATLPARDAVDQRIVTAVQNRTGSIIDDPSEVGGWPDLTQEP